MRPTKYVGLSTFALAASLFLAACGGGGGGTASTTTGTGTTATVDINTAFQALGLNDTYSGSWSGRGGGLGGDGAGGDADSGGGAGDGEFVKVTGKLPTGTNTSVLTWTVLRSQYGQQGKTGTLTVTPDTTTNSLGGYRVTLINGATNTRVGQSNIYVSATGQLTGTLPLTIGGTVKDTVFHTIRFIDAATGSSSTNFSAIAGTYAWGLMTSDITTGANKNASAGVAKLNADGTGRFCPSATTYSSSCVDGVDVVLTYPDAANKSLIRLRAATTQTTAINSNYVDQTDTLLVAKSVFSGSGVAMTGDYLAWNSRCTSCAQRTGAVYLARISDAAGNVTFFGLPQAVGVWNASINYQDGSQGGTKMVTVDNVTGGGTKTNFTGTNSLTCNSVASNSLTATVPANNLVVVFKNGAGTTVGYGFVLDTETAVYVEPGVSFGVLRLKKPNAASGDVGYCAPL